MREKLRSLEGERCQFTATFVRYGTKESRFMFRGRLCTRKVATMLFRNICRQGKEVCDHVWFTLGHRFGAVGLSPGEPVVFEARVTHYWKGYGGDENWTREKDFKLSNPTNIRRPAGTESQLALFA